VDEGGRLDGGVPAFGLKYAGKLYLTGSASLANPSAIARSGLRHQAHAHDRKYSLGRQALSWALGFSERYVSYYKNIWVRDRHR